MKNIKSTNKVRTTNSNESYGLGSSKEGCEGITSEGDGCASKRKPLTAWALEIDGEIDPTTIRPTRAWARADRNDVAEVYGSDAKVSVRKVVITQVAAR